MGSRRIRAIICLLAACVLYVTLNSLAHAVHPEWFIWFDEDREEASWLASSDSWWDRKACRWLSLCGLAHYKVVGPLYGSLTLGDEEGGDVSSSHHGAGLGPGLGLGIGGKEKLTPLNFTHDERVLREIPAYVLEHAPLVHLYSHEQYWPSDMLEHLTHTTPCLNYTPVSAPHRTPTLDDLAGLNRWEKGQIVFLTSKNDVEGRPPWMEGWHNIPVPGLYDGAEDGDDAGGEWFPGVYDNSHGDAAEHENEPWYDIGGDDDEYDFDDEDDDERYRALDRRVIARRYQKRQLLEEQQQQQQGPQQQQQRIRPSTQSHGVPGRSSAPVVLIVVDKGNGIVDAFWFYFYSFNLGNVVLRIRFGNHVGDWEHSLVRFENGKPKAIFFSAHSAGEAFSYDAVEKIGKRPVIYSAGGTHAMYATPGLHTYGLPWGLLHDITDRGPLWDPTLNAHTYTYNTTTDTLRPSQLTPRAPLSWFYFSGHWGDKFYPLNDGRQYRFGGQYHYVNGPLGPRFKHLGRRRVCPGSEQETPCVIRDWIGDGPVPRSRWEHPREGGRLAVPPYEPELLPEPGDEGMKNIDTRWSTSLPRRRRSVVDVAPPSSESSREEEVEEMVRSAGLAHRERRGGRRQRQRRRVRRWPQGATGTGEELSEADLKWISK